MCSYRQLLLWQQATSLAHQIYYFTRDFSSPDRADLAARLRSVAVAIPLHIAVHYSRDGATFVRGLQQARRDLLKLEILVALASESYTGSLWPTWRMVHQMATVRRHVQALLRCLTPCHSSSPDRTV